MDKRRSLCGAPMTRLPLALLARARREGWAWLATEGPQLVAVAGSVQEFSPEIRKSCTLWRVMEDGKTYQRWAMIMGGRW